MQNCPNPNPRRKSNAEKIKFDQDKPHGNTPAYIPTLSGFHLLCDITPQYAGFESHRWFHHLPSDLLNKKLYTLT
jgi:hypothetical protein